MGKKKIFKKEKKHVVFDENERKEYLTGFRKRKLARKLKSKEKLELLLKEEKKKIKQRQRETMQNALITQRQVPEIEHLLKPVTIDLPEHTVTISEFEDFSAVPVTSVLRTKQDDLQLPSAKLKKEVDEVEKIRKEIKELKGKRINSIKNSAALLEAKKRQRKVDKAKAKKMQRLLIKNSKHTKKKHANKKKK